jgi:hypothetical protein
VDEDDNVYVCEHGTGKVLKFTVDDEGMPDKRTVVASDIGFVYDVDHMVDGYHWKSGIAVGTL